MDRRSLWRGLYLGPAIGGTLAAGGNYALPAFCAAALAALNLIAVLIALAPVALAAEVLGVVSNSALTKSVSPEEVGGTLGLSAALDSLARVVTPILGRFLIDARGPGALGILGSVPMAGLIFYVWRRILYVPDLSYPAEAIN